MSINATKELLYSISKSDEKKVAIYSEQGNLTYLDYCSNVKKMEKLLTQIYQGKIMKVGILMDDCIELIFLFWACLKIGIIPILINNKFSTDTVCKCITTVELSNIIVKYSNNEKYMPLTSDFKEFAHHNGLSFLESNTNDCDSTAFINKNVAFGIFTSGSADVPKCVLHSHESIIKCVDSYYKKMLRIKPDDIIYSASKMMHTYGLGNTVFQTVGIRASSIICTDDTIFSVIRNINKFCPTVFFAVPSVYQKIIDISKMQEVDLSSLRLCFSAGEHLSLQLYTAFYSRFGCKIFDGMGNTEYLTTFITNTETKHKVGSCGKCIPGFSAKIVNQNNDEVSNGKSGRLLIKGDIHFCGYYTEEKIYTSDDYFDTLNLCYRDDDGFIWFEGRNDDLFKVNGKWVNPLEIESLLSNIEAIEDTLVVLDTDNGINDTILYIKLKYEFESKINEKEFFHKIKIYIKKNLEHYKCPAKFEFVTKIPKGATGKKKRVVIGK